MTKLLALALLCSATVARAEPTPRLLVGTDPIGLVRDSYALTASYALSDHVAARGEVQLQRYDFEQSEIWRYRASVPIFLDRTFHGPFLEPGVIETHANTVAFSFDGAGNAMAVPVRVQTFGPSMMVGWQWTFHDRYSIAAAVGGSKVWSGSATPGVLGYAGGPEWYVRVGYVF